MLRSIQLVVFAGLIGGVILSAAEPNSDWDAWRGVNRIRGVATAIDHNERYEVTDMYVSDTNGEETAVYRFELVPEEAMPGYRLPLDLAMQYRSAQVSICWVQTECHASGMKNRHNTFTTKSAQGTTSVTSHFSGPLAADSVIQFSIHMKEGTWQCSVPGDLQNPYEEYIHGEGSLPDYNHDEVREMRRGLPVFVSSIPLPKKPGYISGKFEKDFPTEDQPETKFHRLMRVELWPEFEDVELEITIDDYEKWRPLGNIGDSHLAGARMPVKATLKPKGGKLPLTLTPKRFIFKLLDTSREPGVCMNWPLGAKDNDRDLKLAADIAFPDNTLDAEGQTLEIRERTMDAEGHYTAAAQIDSFDFGARAELRVTCELSDGREIVGVFKAPEGDQDIVSLPKGRREGDWVAMSWRKANHADDLPDNDDSESDPKGDGSTGDGYTLYEEYRGWVEAGKHIEGDSKKKDFFVLNERGADARGGITLFERASGLRVHSRVRDGLEMSRQRKCLNANQRDAPHRVDQFGVVIAKDNGLTGGNTVGIDGANPGKAFRPHLVNVIYLESSAAGHGEGIFSIDGGMNAGLSAHDADLAWDRGVAHELLHTVGVDHHGDKVRWKRDCYFQGPHTPGNPTHQPRYVSKPRFYTWEISRLTQPFANNDWFEKRGDTIVVRWEDTGKDVFEDQLAQYESDFQRWRTQYQAEDWQRSAASDAQRAGTTTEFMIDFMADAMAADPLVRRVWVGPPNGTDSGDDFCIMRYYFATGYEIAGMKNAYYLIRPGATHAGRQLCQSPEGTGNNAGSHEPQSRFGDAASGRGNCAGQICPNDAIPPRNLP